MSANDDVGRTAIIERSAWFLLLFVAFALRYAFVFKHNPPSENVFSDMAGFVVRAQRVLDGRFLQSDTLFPPGEHLFIAATGALTNGYDTLAVWLHLVASVLTCDLIGRASATFLGRAGSLAAVAICCFHFPFIALTGYYLAETIFTFLLGLLFFLMTRATFPWRSPLASAIGLVAALGLVWKGTNVFFLPFLALWTGTWLIRRGGGQIRSTSRCWLWLALGFSIAIGGQTLYFLKLYDIVAPLARGGGYNFAMDKCPGSRIVAKNGQQFQSPRTYYTGESGVQKWDADFHEQSFFWKKGLKCIAENPLIILLSSRNIYYLFLGNDLWPVNSGKFKPFNALYQRRAALLLIPGVILGALALRRRLFSEDCPPFLLALSSFASAWMFGGEIRFRVPFDVIFIPISLYGWSWAATLLFSAKAGRFVYPCLTTVYFILLAVPTIRVLI